MFVSIVVTTTTMLHLALSSDLPFAEPSVPVNVCLRSFRARRRLFTGGINDLEISDDHQAIELQR